MGNDRLRRLLTEEERRLWLSVMRDVKPLPGHPRMIAEDDAPLPLPPKQSVSPSPSTPPSKPSVKTISPHRKVTPWLEHGSMPGVDGHRADHLRRGELPIEGAMDLHGLTVEMAHAALQRFVMQSSSLGRRCLLIITGKGSREGTGILHREVPRWLNEPPLRNLLLGFSYAQPKHGGEGALYLLLKRQR